MKKLLVSLLAFAFVAGCSSNPNKAREIDNKIDAKGAVGGSTVGVDGNKEVVVQTETAADVELRELNWKIYDAERKIVSEREQLTRCRTELADPRLGGTGEMTEIPEIDEMKTPNAIKEEIGLTESGELKVVKKEMFGEKLAAQRKYMGALESATKTIAKFKGTCEREMGYARVKHGLPAQRYAAKGHHSGGTWVQQRAPERNLDDAFRIQSEESTAAKGVDRATATE